MITKEAPVVFGTNLVKTKKLGKLLSIDKSYAIIRLLSKEPLMMTTISKKLSIKLPVLTHYLIKIENVGLLTITIKKHPTRKRDTKYYGVKPFILTVSWSMGHTLRGPLLWTSTAIILFLADSTDNS